MARTSLSKVALITGITGQDGSYLAELLLEKGYEVHGVKRRTSSPNLERIQHLLVAGRLIVHQWNYPSGRAPPTISSCSSGSEYAHQLHLHFGDVTDFGSICGLITKIRPKEIYNLAAQSHVQVSFELPSYTAEVAGQVTSDLRNMNDVNYACHVHYYLQVKATDDDTSSFLMLMLANAL